MDKVNLHGKMEMNMKEHGSMIEWKDKEFLNIIKEDNLKDILRITIFTIKDNLF